MSAHHRRKLGFPDLLSFDIGCATAKSALVRGSTALKQYDLEVGRVHEFKSGSGLPVKLPIVRYALEVGTTIEGPAVIEERESTCVLGPGDRGINVPLCYTRAMACYAVKCITVPGMPNNEGAVVPIRVGAPQDSILNAQPPYPTGGRRVTGHMVVPLVFRTLAGALPGQVRAD